METKRKLANRLTRLILENSITSKELARGVLVKGKRQTPDGEIVGFATYNELWGKIQVDIDGVLYAEVDTVEEAIEYLKDDGFENLELAPEAL